MSRHSAKKLYLSAVMLFVYSLSNKVAFSGPASLNKEEQECQVVHQAWLQQALQLTKNCVGFSAPVSARALGYLSISMYEAQVESLPGYRSLSGQLQDYERTTWKKPGEAFCWPHVINTTLLHLTRFLYQNRPPAGEAAIQQTYTRLRKSYAGKQPASVLQASELYGKRIAEGIISWSMNDQGHEGYNRNYPTSYVPVKCAGCWVQTVPGYFPALQPYWGNNRFLLPSGGRKDNESDFMPFSSDTASPFYKGAVNLVHLYNNLSETQVLIARYWDDAPGYSGTPAGHQFALARQLAQKQRLSVAEMLRLYVLLGVAINDAMIECWQLKYKYNLIRPVSYIQRYIDPYFNSAIPTPPFPEFPSGHSFQSGAAAEVFNSVFGNEFSFTDSTQMQRNDIDGTPRRFGSFAAMAEEISISRFYAGIHFEHTLKSSLKYGKRTGLYTIQTLQFLK